MNAREFHTAIVGFEGISEELKAYSQNELDKLDARNAKRKATPTKTQKANEPIKANMLALVKENTTGMTAPQVAERIGEGVTTQKASALLGQLANEGKLNKGKIKVKGKGEQVLYTFVKVDEVEGE